MPSFFTSYTLQFAFRFQYFNIAQYSTARHTYKFGQLKN